MRPFKPALRIGIRVTLGVLVASVGMYSECVYGTGPDVNGALTLVLCGLASNKR